MFRLETEKWLWLRNGCFESRQKGSLYEKSYARAEHAPAFITTIFDNLRNPYDDSILACFWWVISVLKILKSLSDAPGIVARVTSDEEHQMSLTSILFYLLMSGLCAFFQGISAFSVISLISTVSYSVANATKERIFYHTIMDRENLKILDFDGNAIL